MTPNNIHVVMPLKATVTLAHFIYLTIYKFNYVKLFYPTSEYSTHKFHVYSTFSSIYSISLSWRWSHILSSLSLIYRNMLT